jgi:hypothetical protein
MQVETSAKLPDAGAMSATIHAHVRLVKAPDICITDL